MRTKFKIILALLCVMTLISINAGSAEAQTYNEVYITGLNAQPNPVSSGASTTITINTFEHAQWFWLSPTTLARPIIIISVAGRAFLANMISETFIGGGAWGGLYFIWFYQDYAWTHQAQWDGKDSQGNLVPAGPYSVNIYVLAGGAAAFGSVIINIEEQRNIILSLNPTEVFPEYTTTVAATVYDGNNNPVPNYPVTLEALAPLYGLDSDQDCGYHSHDTNRPIGNFLSDQGTPIGSSAQGSTDANGQFTINYQASQFGGVETIKAWGNDGSAVRDEKGLTVRVSGLAALPTSVDGYWRLTGATPRHLDNHYGTNSTNSKIAGIATDYYTETGIAIGVNDMSLPWGGLFDIYLNTNWLVPHSWHRLGKSFDVDHLDVDEITLNRIAANYNCARYEVTAIHYECP